MVFHFSQYWSLSHGNSQDSIYELAVVYEDGDQVWALSGIWFQSYS